MRKIIKDYEATKIALMACAHKAQTEEQVDRVLDWAFRVRAESIMLECVLSGKVSAFVRDDGEIVFVRLSKPL